MPFIKVIGILWLETAMTHLKVNGLIHLDDEDNQRTSLNSESASLKFVIRRPTISLLIASFSVKTLYTKAHFSNYRLQSLTRFVSYIGVLDA